ncbi:MAG: RNA ligase family protein [Candidatus Gottesmanbacteria bacterium]|nr:RNA ligase family protein [Candidatus Gottesmanbacteria bacterium]
MIPAYPKIFSIGSPYIPHLFKGSVEVTEKIDGSQFTFGLDSQKNLLLRSKGKDLYIDDPEKMFQGAIDYVVAIGEKIKKQFPPETFFYTEFLSTPKHNVLPYARIPNNHLMVFAAYFAGTGFVDYKKLKVISDLLDLEVVPLLFEGEIKNVEELNHLLNRTSGLGGETVEGIVVKNYAQTVFIADQVFPSLGKFVREQFKERHKKEWKRKEGKGKWQTFLESFRTDARFRKSVQHLTEKGELSFTPADIGKLMVELKKDVIDEEKEAIKEELYTFFIDEILRKATAGFPEWYKEQLLKKAFT